MKDRVIAFCKKEAVFVIAIGIAVISAFFVTPSKEYFQYLDYKVLALLFCLMIIVAGMKEQGIFTFLGEKLAGKVKDSRQMSLLLVMLCFFSGMLITNDVALITFVPFALELLFLAGMKEKAIKVVVLQTIAANLGSMFTPVGNPQNLYLYGISGMRLVEFLLFMLPLTVLSLVMLCAVIMVEKPQEIVPNVKEDSIKPKKRKVLCYAALFLLCILTVIRIVPWQISLAVVAVVVFIVDKGLFAKVDYCLLGTFVGFFIFVGNMQNIPPVSQMLKEVIGGRELLLSMLSSQVISNVPAAMLLSGFTENYKELLYGVNIGGLGTLIASLASVISYKIYAESQNARKGKYMAVFTVYNLAFLLVLIIVGSLIIG